MASHTGVPRGMTGLGAAGVGTCLPEIDMEGLFVARPAIPGPATYGSGMEGISLDGLVICEL